MGRQFGRVLWAPGDSDGGAPPADGGNQGQGGTPETWEAFYETMGNDVKALYTAHHEGLHNTVKATRAERDNLAKALREATTKLEEGSEARKSLEAVTGQLEAANRKAAFYEAATSREAGCRNPKLAWLAAMEAGAVDDKGAVDWAQLKTGYPELFGAAQAPAQPPLNPTNPAGPNKLTLDAIKRMTTEEINKRWDDVQAVLSQSE